MKVSLLQKRFFLAILFSLVALLAHGQITKEDRGSRGYGLCTRPVLSKLRTYLPKAMVKSASGTTYCNSN